MSNKNSNFPAPSADRALNGNSFTGKAITSLTELAAQGKPQDEDELEQRIKAFFEFCSRTCIRPGIESLALSLGVSRISFWNWCNKQCGKSDRWVELCRYARQIILSFTEQALLTGHLNPPAGIFLMKNIGDYKDTVSFEELKPTEISESTKDIDKEQLIKSLGLNVKSSSEGTI